MKFDEQHLSFDFTAPWKVVRYDEHPQHKERMRYIESQGVDFIGKHDTYALLLEVKDFRGYRIENREKFGGPLAQWVGQKVRDSMIGVIGQRRAFVVDSPWSDVASSICGGSEVRVVLFLQTDRTPKNIDHRKALLSVELKLLKRNLHWAGVKVSVVDLDTYAGVLANLTVRNLPGAGRGNVT